MLSALTDDSLCSYKKGGHHSISVFRGKRMYHEMIWTSMKNVIIM